MSVERGKSGNETEADLRTALENESAKVVLWMTRHRVEVQRHHARALAAEKALRNLAQAAWKVPVKQHDRTPEQQANVEAFTTAVVEAREYLTEHGGVE